MENSYRRANCCQVLFHLFQLQFLCKAYRQKEIKPDDLFNLPSQQDTHHLVGKLKIQWSKEVHKSRPSLLRALCKTFGGHCALNCLLAVRKGLKQTIRTSLPGLYTYLIKLYLESIHVGESSRSIYTTVLLISIILCIYSTVLLRTNFVFRSFQLGLLIRKTLTGILYEKVLRLPASGVASATKGKLIGLASGDMALIEQGSWQIPSIVAAPLAAIFQIVMLYKIIGSTANYCLLILLFTYLLQLPLSSVIVRARLAIGAATDRRLNLINKLILGIQTIKCYVWEQPIISHIRKHRRIECYRFLKLYFWRGFSQGLTRNTNTLFALPIILVPLANGQSLLGSTIFTALTLVDSASISVLNFNMSSNTAADYYSVIKRIQEVLLLEQIKEDSVSEQIQPPLRVVAQSVTTSWSTSQNQESTIKLKRDPKISISEEERSFLSNAKENNQLKLVNQDISLTLEDGRLVAVVGRVGSGKTSLIASLLGETHILGGSLHRRGRVAFVEQEPCIFSDSVRNNILFGLPLNEERLSEVVRVCQLDEDFTQLANGIETQIGERGVNISGGQKARISLARACYSDADIYLLDDPLSAVDPQVAEKLFSLCLRGLLREKAVLLVTHQIAFLPRVDEIVFLQEGRPLFKGSYQGFQIFKEERGWTLEGKRTEQTDDNGYPAEQEEAKSARGSEASSGSPDALKGGQNLIVEEEVSDGGILKTYARYISQSPGCFCNIGLLALSVTPFILMGYLRFFIASWAALPLSKQQDTDTKLQFLVVSFIQYGTGGLSVFLIGALILHFSNQLHNSMLNRVAHAPMRFFHSNPLGRIINRFSKDTAMADSVVTSQVMLVQQLFLYALIFVILIVGVYYFLLVGVLVVLILVFIILKFALKSSVDSLRLDAVSRSPINSFFSASLQNLVTIRAYQSTSFMNKYFQRLVDQNGRAFFSFFAISTWISVQTLNVCVIWIVATLLVSFFTVAHNAHQASSTALAIASSIDFLNCFQFLVIMFLQIQSSMSSIQRMQAYSKLEQEGKAVLPSDSHLPQGWPPKGAIRFDKASLRYRNDFELVLKEIDFQVEPGMKVGVVGRTGAGKSSLLQALFRLVECDQDSSIFIDQISTSKIGLSTLRGAISIIPQSPFIFEGTVRENLDPFSHYSDQEVWEALEDVQLKYVIEQFESKLQEPVSEGASVFSVGQKQLICLARAILRKNRIIVLDEATANVDMETDRLIQETIKRKFSDCTVITVAHRLETVITSDRILVLSHGRVKEYGHPHQLLEKEKGHFRRMVEATGKDRAQQLQKEALQAFKK